MCLNAHGTRLDAESETLLPQTGGVFDVAAYGLSTQQEPKWAENISPTLARPSISGGGQVTAVAFDPNQITSATNRSQPSGDVLHTMPASSTPPHLASPWAVRRLTPVECERLQGFPDDFTRIPYRGKPAESCPDGPRYKAIGNSWAVNVAAWIGERIAEVDAWNDPSSTA